MRIALARIGATLALGLLFVASTATAQKKDPKSTKASSPSGPSGAGAGPGSGSSSAPAAPPSSSVTVAAEPAAPVEVVPAPAAAPVEAAATGQPAGEWDELDVAEKETHKYYFIGLHYSGAVIPKPFINIFVSGGATVYSNSLGIDFEYRKDGFSVIPNVTWANYSTGDMLFLQHDKPASDPGNWSLVNSGLNVIYFGLDLYWSTKIAKNFDFEYGLAFGLGPVFGSLYDNWVTPAPATATYKTASGGTAPALNGGDVVPGYKGYFVPCQTTASGLGCTAADHQNASVNKVGGYTDPFGFNPVPNVFFNVSVPVIGLRIKPIKSIDARVNVAFNIPEGFVFSLNANYGLERLLEKK